MPSTSTATTSPSASDTFGSRAHPTPGGVPVRIRSPGFECEDRGDVADEKRHAEDQVARRAVLKHLAVQPLHDTQPRAVAQFRHRGEAVAERAERVEPLCSRPLTLAVLDVSGRQVVRAAVAAHMRQRFALCDAAPANGDLDCELRLRVHVRRFRRQDDRIAGADECVLELPEQERFGGWVVSQFRGMFRIVPPGADDFHGPILTQ